MTRVCAWCSEVLEVIDDGDERVSHGICKSCAEKLEQEMEDDDDDAVQD